MRTEPVCFLGASGSYQHQQQCAPLILIIVQVVVDLSDSGPCIRSADRRIFNRWARAPRTGLSAARAHDRTCARAATRKDSYPDKADGLWFVGLGNLDSAKCRGRGGIYYGGLSYGGFVTGTGTPPLALVRLEVTQGV